MTAERRIQVKRKAAGKCLRCGDPTPAGVHCDDCRQHINDHRLLCATKQRIPYLINKGLLDPKEVVRLARNSHHISDPSY